jgi:DNA-binding NtrC family response regulator
MAATSDTDITILIAEDDTDSLRYMQRILSDTYPNILSATNGDEALRIVGEKPVHLVITDIYMPGLTGLQLMERVKKKDEFIEFILITGKADVEQAVSAVKSGCYDYLPKPVDADTLQITVRRAVEKVKLVSDNIRLRSELRSATYNEDIVGSSQQMRDIFEKIEIIKDADSNVLIQGETGTGKELVARYIHYKSKRANGPFVKLNCGAIPRDLLESELFGHEKGSFTGAISQRIGRFEMAHRGTILLDEIGDMPLELQIKLLAVIQDRVIERIGGTKTIPVDVRIVAATHQDLDKAIEDNRFREDLYYRLNVINVFIPPLRERREDIPLLVEHFIRLYAEKTGRRIAGVDPAAMRVLMTYDYPGNVRELENIIERATVLARDELISPVDLPEHIGQTRRQAGAIAISPGTPLQDVERICLLETLKMVGGNKRKAAELLGISEKSIYNKLQRYGVTVTADV